MAPRVTARRWLREGTGELHRAAEECVAILDDRAGRATYESYLAGMLGFHLAAEALFEAHAELSQTPFDVDGRRRSRHLEADLTAMGAATDVPSCHLGVQSDTLARALGVAYIVEGSTLGGRHVLKRLPPNLVELRGVATRYLEGYGPATGSRWRQFLVLLEGAVDHPAARASALRAAQATLAALIRHLQP